MNKKEMKKVARNISPYSEMTAFDQQDPECKIAEKMAEILKNTAYDKESDSIGSRLSILDLEAMNLLTTDPDGLPITTWAKVTIQDRYSERKNGDLQSYEDFWDRNNPEHVLGKRTFWQKKYMTFSIFNYFEGQDYVHPLCTFSTYFMRKHKSHIDLCIGDMLYQYSDLQEDITINIANNFLNKEGGIDVDMLRIFVGLMLSVANKAKVENEEKFAKMSKMLGVA
tara:strand:+ start:287 stop:961 length:675 start_codon:yes stop_codon:yes gene_type:complete